jgi:hypothetical protein
MVIAKPKSRPKLEERSSMQMHEWDRNACHFISRDECGQFHGKLARGHRLQPRVSPISVGRDRMRWQSNFDELHYQSEDRLADPVEETFNFLADRWERETRNITSPKVIANHPYVRAIIKIGKDVVPLILNRMKHHPWFWFGALMEITGETTDPIADGMRGDMQAMTEAWIRWGESRAII